MKQYKRGRTEAVSACSSCMHAVVIQLHQVRPVSAVSVSAAGILAGKDGVDWSSSSALPLLLQQFFTEHKTQIAQCKTGNGVDRHLQGLKWRSELKNGGKADDFFASPGWAALQANQLSTSQMTAEGIQASVINVLFFM
jgi:hypothetical protein